MTRKLTQSQRIELEWIAFTAVDVLTGEQTLARFEKDYRYTQECLQN